MVEYRHDPTTGRSAFMEVNGRFWGSQPLAYHAGAPFGWYTYSVLGLFWRVHRHRLLIAPASRCRFVIPDTCRLLTVLFNPQAVQNRHLRLSRWGELRDYLVDFFRPRGALLRLPVARIRSPPLADLTGVLVKGDPPGLQDAPGRIRPRARLSAARARPECAWRRRAQTKRAAICSA